MVGGGFPMYKNDNLGCQLATEAAARIWWKVGLVVVAVGG